MQVPSCWAASHSTSHSVHAFSISLWHYTTHIGEHDYTEQATQRQSHTQFERYKWRRLGQIYRKSALSNNYKWNTDTLQYQQQLVNIPLSTPPPFPPPLTRQISKAKATASGQRSLLKTHITANGGPFSSEFPTFRTRRWRRIWKERRSIQGCQRGE